MTTAFIVIGIVVLMTVIILGFRHFILKREKDSDDRPI